MGERGPIPKRKGKDDPKVTVAPGAETVEIPLADPTWHEIAIQLWVSLTVSGQRKFYEPSDWALAYSLCDDLSYYKSMPRRSGQMLASIMSSMSSLLVTEGDRRRVQMELSRPTTDQLESEGVTEMKAWQERLGKRSG